MVLNVFLGFAASATVVETAHWITLATTILMLVIVSYNMFKGAFEPCGRGYGPLLLTLLATPLILCNPILNLLEDKLSGQLHPPVEPFMNFITWIGIGLLVLAVMWQANLDIWLRNTCCKKKPRGANATAVDV